VRETLLSYYPYGYAKSSDYVEQVSEAAHSTHKGWLARGGIVPRFGAAAAPPATAPPRAFRAAQLRGAPTHTPAPTIRPDRNFTIQVLRFYCEQTDRTFTIIAALDIATHCSPKCGALSLRWIATQRGLEH
jgi:hypothetical protein